MENNPMATHLPSPPKINLIGSPRQTVYPECTKCGLIFKKDIDLRKHLDKDSWESYIQEKFKDHQFRCDECCLFFKASKAYMQHLGKAHNTDIKCSKCLICGRLFKSKYAVKFHVRQVHEKSTRTDCPLCGKQFYSKYLIPPHMLKCNMRS